MCYLKKIEYEIVLNDSLSVIRSCSRCGRKTHFTNTNRFRVNANGNKLDVWLIYQCGKCKHTLNLAIYERKKVSSIPKDEYRRFLDNDKQLAELYGKSMQLFRENKADVDLEILDYAFVRLHETAGDSHLSGQLFITIHNPLGLKIHPEKQLAEVLRLSRGQVKKLVAQGGIQMGKISAQFISASVNACHLHAEDN